MTAFENKCADAEWASLSQGGCRMSLSQKIGRFIYFTLGTRSWGGLTTPRPCYVSTEEKDGSSHHPVQLIQFGV